MGFSPKMVVKNIYLFYMTMNWNRYMNNQTKYILIINNKIILDTVEMTI